MKQRPYLRPWVSSGHEEARLKSAATLLTFAAENKNVTPEHFKRLVKDLLWGITEGDGKYTTRYRSQGVLDLEKEGFKSDWRSYLRHDHVVTRQALSRRIMEGEDPETVLRDALACVVTKEEHSSLTKFDKLYSGWDRYREAGIAVIDMSDGSRMV